MQSPPVRPESGRRRPTGILLLATLAVMDGIFDTIAAITALSGAGVVNTQTALNGGLLTLVGLIIGVVAFLLFCLAYGLWTMRPWAWSLGVGVEIANVVLAFVRLASGETYTGVLLTLVIAGTILYYLMQRPVRAIFGRA